MDHYSILGVTETASQDEIKQAYKRLAMKHHPDRGGDTIKFQEISQANDILSDPQKRAQYDAERTGRGGTQFHFQAGNPFDPFGQMFGGANPFEQFFGNGNTRQRHRNRDLNIRCIVSFKQSYTGTDMEANYMLPTGKTQTVVIKVPAGIESGQVIRYGGMGDDTIPNIQRGDLNVTVIVEPSNEYERRGDDLISRLVINPLEAMFGCTRVVNTLDDNAIRINLQPGVHHGAEFLTRGLGFPNINSRHRGNFIVQTYIDVPSVTDPTLKSKFEKLYAEISKSN